MIVAFDVGETLIDETRQWATWAQWLGTTPFSLMVALGAVLERGEPFKFVFELFDEKFDIDIEIERRDAAGTGYRITADALHTDVMPALRMLSEDGLQVVIAGTMTVREAQQIGDLSLPVSRLVSHRELGSTNRSPEFFHALRRVLGHDAGRIVYVSHRPDVVCQSAGAANVEFRPLLRGPIGRIRQLGCHGAVPDSLTEICGGLLREGSD